MDAARIHQMRALLLIERIQIGDMLEIIGVIFTALHHLIRLHIIVKYRHFQSIALLRQDRLYLL